MTLAVGVVGLGVISRYYLAALERVSGLELAAVCDRDPAKLVPVAPTVRAARDVEDLLADPELDALVVNLPNHLHAEVCAAALEAGKHCCCEKPLTLDAGEADELLRLADRRGRTLFTAFHRRYNRHVLALARALGPGERPALVRVRYWERIEDHCGSDSWYLDPDACGGGCIADNGPNALDLLLLLAGPVELVSARVLSASGGVDLRAELVARSARAERLEVSLDWAYPGEQKDVLVEREDGSRLVADMLEGHPRFKSSLLHEYEGVLEDFAAHCRRGRSNRNGAEVVRLVEEAYALAAPTREREEVAT